MYAKSTIRPLCLVGCSARMTASAATDAALPVSSRPQLGRLDLDRADSVPGHPNQGQAPRKRKEEKEKANTRISSPSGGLAVGSRSR